VSSDNDEMLFSKIYLASQFALKLMMRKSFFADIMGQKYLLMQLKFSMKSCWRHKISYPKNLIVK